LHGDCKITDKEEKPFGIGCIGPSEGEMRECDARGEEWHGRPDGVDFLIEGDQNIPDEKRERSDWGKCQEE
jgi:hypothetical protein